MRGISRRGFLGGAAGVLAAAALPASTTRAATLLSGRDIPGVIPRPARGGNAVTVPLVGATVNPGSYGVKTYLDAANIFDGFVGGTLATTFQKVYLSHGAFGQQPPGKMLDLASAGCQFLVSIEPSKTLTASEQTVMARWLKRMNQSGLSYKIVLFSECNDRAFKTVDQWLPYWQFYAPVVKDAGVPCGYDPGCGFQAIARAEQYFPTSPAPDELWMDYYASAFRGGSRLGNLINIAKSAGVPAGLAEWGWSAGDTTFGPMTMPWWNTYCAYLTSLAGQGDLALGAIHFAAKANGRTPDVINSSDDPRIPQIHAVSQAIQNG